MNPSHIEPLEPRTLLSHNSVAATASISLGDNGLQTFASVTLNWTRASTAPIDGFDILRSDDDGKTYYSIDQTTDTSFVDGATEEGQKYFYRVCPFTNKGGDQASLGTTSVITPLSVPELQLSCDGDGSVYAECDSDTESIESFKLRWWPDDDPSNVNSTTLSSLQDDSGDITDVYANTTINGLNPLKLYDFSLTQSDSVTTSDEQTSSIRPFSPPWNVDAYLQSAQAAVVKWADDPTIATGFKVSWDQENELGDDIPDGSMVVGKGVRSVTIPNLAPGFVYDFGVQALHGKLKSDVGFDDQGNDAQVQVDPPLDTAFNGDGLDNLEQTVLTTFPHHDPAVATGIALLHDGLIVMAGTVRHNFMVTRYTSYGVLDTTFGDNGHDAIDFGGNDSASGVAVLPDGNILVTGTSNNSFAMAELKPDGTLNHAFGHHGRIGYSDGESLNASTLALAPNGNGFFISGIATTGTHHSAIVQQFQTNGTPNPVWDSVATRIPNVTGAQTAMAIQSTQKIILACQMGNAIVISRFNRDGSVDATFGAGGEQLIHFGKSAQDVFGMAIDPRNNSIVLCGSSGSGASSTFAIARLTANGKLDTTFNATGIAQTFIKSNRASAQALTVLPTGNIVAVGTANGNFAIAEFTPAGQLDKHFNSDGVATTDQGSPTDIAMALANPNDGSIYLAGTSGGDFSVARYFIDSN